MLIRLAVLSLAAFKITEMITQHDGPGQIFFKLRCRLSPHGIATPGSLGELLTCFSCLSLWVSIVLLAVPTAWLVPIAAAGVATIVQYWLRIGFDESF